MKFKSKYIFLFAILLYFCAAFGRPLDLQYSYTGLPFAVFYNPALILDNSGYIFGLDTEYKDKSDHNFRSSLVVPLDKVKTEENFRSGNFRGDGRQIRNGRNAVSFGLMYDSFDNYQISAGFGTFTRLFQAGASFDITSSNNDGHDLSVNLGISKEAAPNKVFSLAVRNVVVSDRRRETLPGLSVGFGGILHQSLMFMPFNFVHTCYIDSDGIDRFETSGSIKLDFMPILMRNNASYSMNASVGFTLRNNKRDDEVFVNFGIAFMNRPSLSAVFVGANGEHKYGAILYNSSGDDFNSDLYANIRYVETDYGEIIFNLESGGGKIESWILKIEDSGNREIRTFSGGSIVPSTIKWDGLDRKRSPVKNQVVHARLIVIDDRKNVCESRVLSLKR